MSASVRGLSRIGPFSADAIVPMYDRRFFRDDREIDGHAVGRRRGPGPGLLKLAQEMAMSAVRSNLFTVSAGLLLALFPPDSPFFRFLISDKVVAP